MKLIKGIKHTLIIDDTYNSSPEAAKRALETLKEIETSGSRWAVLADMLELGKYTEEGHREVGRKVVEEGVDILVTIGERACHIAQGAQKAGMGETKIFSFAKKEPAGKFIQSRLREGDLILIKGSQGMRMEKIVKELMAEPLRAQEFLVRQEKEWLER